MTGRTDTIVRRDSVPGPSPGAGPVRRVDPAVLHDLSQVDTRRGLGHVAAEWTAIVVSVVVCRRVATLPVYLLTVVWIGARQHALFLLMHEASHHRLARSPRLNDTLGEVLLAWPFAITLASYRRNHFAHHRLAGTEADPDRAGRRGGDWAFPLAPGRLALVLVRTAAGLTTIQGLRGMSRYRRGSSSPASSARSREVVTTRMPVRRSTVRVAVSLVVLSVIVATGHLVVVLLFWGVPLLTWFRLVMRVRVIAEHHGVPRVDGEEVAWSAYRTTRGGLVGRVLVVPKNSGYHIEHHFVPSVPFYNLPALHEVLQREPAIAEHAHVTKGYLRVLAECCGRPAAPAPGGRQSIEILANPSVGSG